MGVFNDWIPPTIHTGFYSVSQIDSGDDSGYYVYLRSLFFDKDLDFYNERFYSHLERFNPTGYVFNNWQVGQSFLILPFFILGHLGALILNGLGNEISLDGYSFPYHLSTALASQTYIFLGLLITFQIYRKYFSEAVSLFTTLTVWMASPLVYYTFIRQRMAHTVEFFLASLFILLWLNNRESSNIWKHALLGSVLGFLGSVRIIGIGLVILYIVDQLFIIRRFDFKRLPIKSLVCFFLFCFIFLSIQLVSWKIIDGIPLPVYHLNLSKDSSTPFFTIGYFENFVTFFLGNKWGIVFSSPILVMGVIGVIFFKKIDGLRIPIFLTILAYVFLTVQFINNLVSYQFRHLIPIYPLIGLGVGYVISEAFGYRFTRLPIIILCSVFVAIQYLILIQYKIVLPFQDPKLTLNALLNLPIIISERSELLLRSTNIFKLLSLDVSFNWTYKELSYFVFYPLFQLAFAIVSYKVFYRVKAYFEKAKSEKLKQLCVFGILIIFVLNLILIASGPEKAKAEIEARQNYLELKEQAKKAEANGNASAAISFLKKAAESVPGLWIARFNLALALNTNGDIEGANKYYEEVLSLNPQHQVSKFNLAKNLEKLGKLVQAEELLRSSIRDNPMNPKPYQALAQLLAMQKKVEESERFFNRAISLDPNFEMAYLNFAILLNSLKRYKESEDFFRKVIVLNPKFGMAHLNFAILLTNLKRYDEAIHHIKIAFDEGINSPMMGSLMKFYGIQAYEVRR